jgi:glutamate N-acetyltransferase/amino-acid N-acetyltransferase
MDKALAGFTFSTVCAGIKGTQKDDMALIAADTPARWVGVFTKNRVKAAPVLYGMKRLREGSPVSAILVNSGNANACNGPAGMEDLRLLCRTCAARLNVPEEQVLMASTGVIGARLPVDKMQKTLISLVEGLGMATLKDVATAMMTTDRYPKWRVCHPEGFPDVTVGGVVKGAGMISPSMATMLGFFITDAGLPMDSLRKISTLAVEESFNRITVDGDQSTNDTVLVLDRGDIAGDKKRVEVLEHAMATALTGMMVSLAREIVDNGEGVTKVVTLEIKGARTAADAEMLARHVGRSPLVKTAFFGEDPNWGRLIAALGASGVPIDPNRIDIRFNGIILVENSRFAGAEAERQVAKVMKNREFTVTILLGQGPGSYHLVTSDLSGEYIKINADYRS